MTHYLPTAQGQYVPMGLGAFVDVTLLGSDVETPADGLAYRIVRAPAHGGVNLAGPTARYTPGRAWYGEDSFSFVTVDADGAESAPAEVVVGVPLYFGARHWVNFRNLRNELVWAGMYGKGYGLIYLARANGVDIRRIRMAQTTAASSLLLYSPLPTARTSLQGLVVAGPLNWAYGPRIDLAGPVDVQGRLAMLYLGDVTAPATVTASSQGWGATFVFGRLDGGAWDVQGGLGTLRVIGRTQDFSLSVRGSLWAMVTGDVLRTGLLVTGMIYRSYCGAWSGGSFTATRARTIHFLGDLEADVTINPLGLAQIQPVLQILSVCGTFRNADLRVSGDADMIHFDSVDTGRILIGATGATGSAEDFTTQSRVNFLMLGNPYRPQALRASTVSAWMIGELWLVARLQPADSTVQYHLNPYVDPGRVNTIRWVRV